MGMLPTIQCSHETVYQSTRTVVSREVIFSTVYRPSARSRVCRQHRCAVRRPLPGYSVTHMTDEITRGKKNRCTIQALTTSTDHRTPLSPQTALQQLLRGGRAIEMEAREGQVKAVTWLYSRNLYGLGVVGGLALSTLYSVSLSGTHSTGRSMVTVEGRVSAREVG